MSTAAGQLLATLLLVGIAFGGGIQKWRTPDGKLFFGEKPPPGSTLIGEVEPGGSISSPEMTGQRTPATPAKKSTDRGWKHGERCGHLVSVKDTVTETHGSYSQHVRGTVKNRSRETVRNVKVCAGGQCATVAWELEPGEIDTFWLDTDHMIGQRNYHLEVICSTSASREGGKR